MLNAAAATGDERIEQAFLQWHHRGHHSKTQGNIKRRLARAGTRMTPGQGAGAILAAAKEQHGAQWWKLLPPELQYGGGGGVVIPSSLMRSRASSDTRSPSSQAPDMVPSMQELERLSAAAQPTSLMASRGPADDPSPKHGQPAEPADQSQQIEILLAQLYTIETERKLITEEGEQQLTPQEARYRADQIESELQSFPVFRLSPQRIRTRLLEIFCDCNQISQRDDFSVPDEPLVSDQEAPNEYLVDGLLVRGASYLIYSLPGVGKTLIGLMLARAALGAPGHTSFLGFKVTPPSQFSQSRVLYIASDGGLFAKGDIKRYLKRYGEDRQEWVNYTRTFAAHRDNTALPWRMNLRGLHRLITTFNYYEAQGTPITLLVIDSLKACMPEGILIGDQALARYLEVIEGICGPRNITTIYLTHQSKESETPQGIAALTEMVHGYFRLRVEEGQHYFCISKLRDGKGAHTEIPYKMNPDGRLCISGDGNGEEVSSERGLIRAFADHYNRHLARTKHLQEGDPASYYRGIQRSDIPLLLNQAGIRNPSWRNPKNLDRTIAALVKAGDLQKVARGHYAIGHAEQADAIQQRGLDLNAGSDEPDLDGPDVVPGWDDLG
ncbi:AAA family ATPase [Synechococcus sp. CBW1004]|uniref:AAA family ATPase n=1 Tax=Synechococcus sp. CBW1004 TaxID=1353136 RepID=UPI0018CE42EA|nr:AAA family ATPase [Synechococcus sp. CBW1004]QPN61994.1 AAA family ATPase [Synechococcus sp. CBW1004]